MISRLLLARWLRRTALAVTVALMALTSPTAPPRVEAAGIVVNTLVDANPPATDGLCSLREAITNANTNTATWPDCQAGAGADTITFGPGGVITLVATLPIVTDVAGLTIDGNGYDVTILATAIEEAALKVAAGGQLTFARLVLAAVQLSPPYLPRGIENNGILIVQRAWLVNLERSLVNNASGTLTVTESTVRDGWGSGLRNSGVATIAQSTFLHNNGGNACPIPCYGSGGGGGIDNTGSLTVTNSTLSGNSAFGGNVGGAIRNYPTGSVSLYHTTITANTAGTGGGIVTGGGAVFATNTVFAGNSGLNGRDCLGAMTTTGPNLIESLLGCTVTGPAPIVGVALLGPLANNGGPTQTQAPLPGSPALGAADPGACGAPPVNGKDQRGVSRPQGAGCDLGAFESGALEPVGGKNLKVAAQANANGLTWESGSQQTGYTLFRWNLASSKADITQFPAHATSAADADWDASAQYCYVLFATNASAMLGSSDLMCALRRLATGTPLPAGFSLSLNQSTSAVITFTAGGAARTDLIRIPLDGAAVTTMRLNPGTHVLPLPAAGMCFQLLASDSASYGLSDVLCGVPGVSTLSAGGRVASIEEVAERVAEAGRAAAAVALE